MMRVGLSEERPARDQAARKIGQNDYDRNPLEGNPSLKLTNPIKSTNFALSKRPLT
jgi:hypothetical protein